MTSISSLSASLTTQRASLFSRIDTNGDSKVSKEEFVSNRPSDVSETQASTLFDKMDTQSTGSLTEDQLHEGMEANKPEGKAKGGQLSDQLVQTLLQLLQQASSNTQTTNTDSTENVDAGKPTASVMFDAMDSDGNGSVSKTEFLAARPDDVSESQAESLYNSIDTEGTGSITLSQFEDSFPSKNGTEGIRNAGGQPHGPPPPPPPSEESDETASTDESESLATTKKELLAQLMEAIEAYTSSSTSTNPYGYGGLDDLIKTSFSA